MGGSCDDRLFAHASMHDATAELRSEHKAQRVMLPRDHGKNSSLGLISCAAEMTELSS